MKSRYEHLQDPRQRRRLVLFRSSAAAGLVATLLAAAVLLPHSVTPVAQIGAEFDAGLPPLAELPSSPMPDPVLQSAGTDDPDPYPYEEQPPTF